MPDRKAIDSLTLDRGKSVELEIFNGNGQPVTGAAIAGLSEQAGRRASRLKESRATILALGADRPRRVVAIHEAQGLAGSTQLTGDETAPVRFTLEKAAAIRGRAVDESGNPISSAEFQGNFHFRNLQSGA